MHHTHTPSTESYAYVILLDTYDKAVRAANAAIARKDRDALEYATQRVATARRRLRAYFIAA